VYKTRTTERKIPIHAFLLLEGPSAVKILDIRYREEEVTLSTSLLEPGEVDELGLNLIL